MRRASDLTPDQLAAVEVERRTPYPADAQFIPFYRARDFFPKEKQRMTLDPIAINAASSQRFWDYHRPAVPDDQTPHVEPSAGITRVLRDDRKDPEKMAAEEAVTSPQPRVHRLPDGTVEQVAAYPNDPGVRVTFTEGSR